jgi:hypothetical protein
MIITIPIYRNSRAIKIMKISRILPVSVPGCRSVINPITIRARITAAPRAKRNFFQFEELSTLGGSISWVFSRGKVSLSSWPVSVIIARL